MRDFYYLGCGDRPGHHLFTKDRQWAWYSKMTERLEKLDGDLAPAFDPAPYQMSFSRLGAIGYSAISWWDHSVDKREGSNSIIFAPTLFSSRDDILYHAKPMFPWVFSRLPQELVWSTAYPDMH